MFWSENLCLQYVRSQHLFFGESFTGPSPWFSLCLEEEAAASLWVLTHCDKWVSMAEMLFSKREWPPATSGKVPMSFPFLQIPQLWFHDHSTGGCRRTWLQNEAKRSKRAEGLKGGTKPVGKNHSPGERQHGKQLGSTYTFCVRVKTSVSPVHKRSKPGKCKEANLPCAKAPHGDYLLWQLHRRDRIETGKVWDPAQHHHCSCSWAWSISSAFISSRFQAGGSAGSWGICKSRRHPCWNI